MDSNKSLIKRIMLGLGANAFGQVVTVIIQLVSVPIFLHYWGVQLYGEWLILTAIPAYFALSDVGFASVAANEMTMLVARGDRDKAIEVFQSTWVFICIASAAIYILAVSAIYFLPITHMLKISLLPPSQVTLILMILVFHIMLGLQGGLFDAGYRCDGNYAIGVFWLNLLRLSESMAMIAVVTLDGTPLYCVLAFLGVRAIGYSMMRLILYKKSPWIKFGVTHVKIATVKKLSSPAIAFMAYPLGNMLNIQGMVIAVSTILGPTYVVAFSTARTLSRLAFQAIDKIKNTIWPEISAAFGAHDIALARTLHRQFFQLSSWLAVTLVVFLLIFGQKIYIFWTHGKVSFDYVFFALLLLGIVVNTFWYMSSVIQTATNQHQKQAVLYIFGNVFAVISTFITIPHWGLTGAALSLIFLDALMSFYVLRSSMALLNDQLPAFILFVAKPPVWIFQYALRLLIYKQKVPHEG